MEQLKLKTGNPLARPPFVERAAETDRAVEQDTALVSLFQIIS